MPDLVSRRPANAADISTTAALARAGQQELKDDRGGRWHLEHDIDRDDPESIHVAALGDEHSCVIVGMIDDSVVVGFARAHLSEAESHTLCMIEELVVHPDARAIGVGSEILAGVREWAIDQGCAAIESQVLPGNRAAKNFFERVGMKTRKMRVSADLA